MKRNKNLIIVLLALLVILVTATTIYAANVFYPEPPRGKDVPSDVTWDSRNGQYISNDVEVDPSNGALRLKDNRVASTDPAPDNLIDPKEKWLKDHKNSSNEIDKALIKYDEESKKNPSNKSYYDPADDKAITVLTSLGEEHVPEMVSRIEKGDEWSGILMFTVQEITKISGGHIDASPEGKNKWVQKFKQNSNGKY